ncbi:hypothetical protein [Micromonospora sp. NPDC047730]|uniref:hypothetical protein n=1 Tax=Micromonospora sp. NPDC047730 TaxID=3364253 RepID=UPI00371F8821
MTTDDRSPDRLPEERPDGPRTDVALDLDTLEREGAKDPFTFRHGGKRFMMSDPQEIDWQKLLVALRDPVFFMTLALPADDREEFFSLDMPSWKMNRLVKAYSEHYGLPSPGEAAGSPS